ncbi:cold shock domain-containing protein CG9705 [Chrysoperla carnea]|uniref:cold shock domain-containing protein CG9705 n=1 Tax=Chrysoperla carnea TaxID=189513 RepID=UPI001D05D212|nr:cold shock domain-containing protein CG9705 [Chrysoperla carnea]
MSNVVDEQPPVQKLLIPSPIITKRTRTASTSARASERPESNGVIKSFCRAKGHGFVQPKDGGEDLFVHISDIEGEYVPLPGDEVKYRLCPIPPKFEKFQAVQVHIINLTPEVHLKWDCLPSEH